MKGEESEKGLYVRLRRFGEKVFDFTILPITYYPMCHSNPCHAVLDIPST